MWVVDLITKNMLIILNFLFSNIMLDAIYVALAGVIIMMIIKQYREARRR